MTSRTPLLRITMILGALHALLGWLLLPALPVTRKTPWRARSWPSGAVWLPSCATVPSTTSPVTAMRSACRPLARATMAST